MLSCWRTYITLDLAKVAGHVLSRLGAPNEEPGTLNAFLILTDSAHAEHWTCDNQVRSSSTWTLVNLEHGECRYWFLIAILGRRFPGLNHRHSGYVHRVGIQMWDSRTEDPEDAVVVCFDLTPLVFKCLAPVRDYARELACLIAHFGHCCWAPMRSFGLWKHYIT